MLREDLSKEYYAVLGLVSSYDGWLLIVKGWSVTLSLAALGLGFQQRHFALFALAAVTGAAFWYLDGLMKGFQYRYYVRMREIECTAYLINRVSLGGKYGNKEISAPRIDMTWEFKGYRVVAHTPEGDDRRANEPRRREPQEIHTALLVDQRRDATRPRSSSRFGTVHCRSTSCLGLRTAASVAQSYGRLPALAAHHLAKRPHIGVEYTRCPTSLSRSSRWGGGSSSDVYRSAS